jgi:hypothetical protein
MQNNNQDSQRTTTSSSQGTSEASKAKRAQDQNDLNKDAANKSASTSQDQGHRRA